MDLITALGIAVVAAPLIMQLIKAVGIATDKDIVPFIAGALGFVICLAAGWLMDEPVDKDLIITCIIAAFGPSGFYELIVKRVPVIGQP